MGLSKKERNFIVNSCNGPDVDSKGSEDVVRLMKVKKS